MFRKNLNALNLPIISQKVFGLLGYIDTGTVIW